MGLTHRYRQQAGSHRGPWYPMCDHYTAAPLKIVGGTVNPIVIK